MWTIAALACSACIFLMPTRAPAWVVWALFVAGIALIIGGATA